MRLGLICVLVAAACGGLDQSPSIGDMGGGGGGFGGGSDGGGGGGGGTGSGGGGGAIPLSSCGSDADCELASSACCECPTFALNVADANSGCSEVTCGAMTCSQNVRAACLQDECQLQCVPLECDLSCADGFVVDTSGCLTCACAEPSQDACTPDANQPDSCVEVGADCCGCARGGKDVAILQSQVAQFQAALNCPADPQCPETNTCDAGAHATCSQSRCELLDNADQPANECGLPSDAGCGSNVCVINAIDAANARHVGVCLGSP